MRLYASFDDDSAMMNLIKKFLYQSEMQLVFDDVAYKVNPYVLLILLLILCWVWFKKKDKYYLLFSLLFGVYFFLFISQAFFPINVTGWYPDGMRENATFASRINLLPLHLNEQFDLQSDLQTSILNILLTIPFGFGINFLKKLKWKKIFVLSFAVGIIVEMLQLLISFVLGYPYRVIDINDVLFNAIGILLGYLAFRIFAKVYNKIVRDSPLDSEGLSQFLVKVTRLHPASD